MHHEKHHLRTFGWLTKPMLNEYYMEANFLANFKNEYQRIECMKNIILKAFGWLLEPMLNQRYMQSNFVSNFQNENQKIECIMKSVI